MPIKRCSIDGKDGWKYGDSGTCYSGPDGKRKAIAQAIAVNKGQPPTNEKLNDLIEVLAVKKTGFDFDGVISTRRGQSLFQNTRGDKWVISARSHGSNDFWMIIDRIGIDRKRVIFTSSNQEKVEEIKRLGIEVFYDNNPTVRSMLPSVVRLF
jgi:hypothetical protein